MKLKPLHDKNRKNTHSPKKKREINLKYLYGEINEVKTFT